MAAMPQERFQVFSQSGKRETSKISCFAEIIRRALHPTPNPSPSRGVEFRVAFGAVLAGMAALAATAPARAAESAREAIVTNQPGDSVSIIDLATMKPVAEIKIGGKPAGVAVSPDKKFAYTTSPDGKEVAEIDLEKREVIQQLKVGDGPLGLAAHPFQESSRAEIYVADWYAHKINILKSFVQCAHADPKHEHTCVPVLVKEKDEIPVGQSPSGLAVTPDGKLLLSADRDSNQISIIDIDARKVIGTVATGERPFGVSIDADGKRAYTANVASDDVSVIDLGTRKLAGTVKVGRRPYAVALSAGKGFVTDQYAGTVTVFDVATLRPIKSIEACDHPEGIEADGPQGAVYVACWGDNALLKIDPEKLEITGKAETGDGPRAFGKFLR